MSAQHTPGPWRVGTDLRAVCVDWRDERGNLSRDAITRNGWAKIVAKIPHGTWASVSEHVANARLIAAAPGLLSALESYMFAEEIDDADVRQAELAVTRQDARAAIAKARGEVA